jgi:hypothetical protein
MVARCADETQSPESIIATLQRDARRCAEYTPGRDSLASWIAHLPPEPVKVSAARFEDSLARVLEVLGAVPDDLKPDPDEHGLAAAYERFVEPEWTSWADPLRRYLAAKAFASWTAYQGRGLLTIVRGLEGALALVRVEAARQGRNHHERLNGDLLKEAIRQSDFILNHLAVSEELALIWSRAEGSHVKDRNDRTVVARPDFA